MLRDPVDIGDGEVAGWTTGWLGMVGATGASSRSRNGFLLLLGEVKGLDLPIVANFCVWLAVSDCDWEVEGDVLVVVVGRVGGATKFPMKGLVLLIALLAVSGAVVVGGAETPELRKLSEKRVSLWSPAIPFSEKWVTLMGRDTLEGERGVARVAMLERRSMFAGWEVTVVVVMVGELSTSIN